MSHTQARKFGGFIALCLFFMCSAHAAQQVPVDSFVRHPELSQPRLSPDGQYIAMRMDYDGGDMHALVVYKIDDMSHPVSMLRMPRYELPANIIWVSPTRLIVEKGKELGSIDKPYLTGEIIATDYDGKNQEYLYGYQAAKYSRRHHTADRGAGFVSQLPEHPDSHFFMGAVLWDSDNHSWLYDVDSATGVRHLVGDIGVGGMGFMVGADGKAHFAYGYNNDYDYVVYHRHGNGGWTPLSAEQIGQTFTPIWYTPDHKRIYAWYDAEEGPASLVEQDETGTNRSVLAKAGFGSLGDIQWTAPPRQPFAAIPDTGLPKAVFVDTSMPAAKLYIALTRSFPGEFIDFINYSEDGGQLLFSASSDRDPGTYYLIDTHTYKVRKLFEAASWIDPTQMAERRPFHFKASDGMELEGILTLPPKRSEANLPMVLLPHGGPHGVSDDWFFDGDAHFLARR
jgi:dipeptidyl aminopeptidase/acylaminoacyl peptidase